MKRVYNALGPVLGKRLRDYLEFNGGVTDNYLHPAQTGVDRWNTAYAGKGQTRFRQEPGSPDVQPRIPSASGERVKYNVGYYSHDARRNQDAVFELDAATVAAGGVPPRAPEGGSAGAKNVAVERYDATGLRTAMTTSWAALKKELEKVKPNHLPTAASFKDPHASDAATAKALEAQGLNFGGPLPRSKTLSASALRHADQW